MPARTFRPMIKYPVTAHAPARARKLPHMARSFNAFSSPGQKRLFFQLQASDKPITDPPHNASASPRIAARVNFSFSSSGESNATQSGPELTNNAELATLVNSSEVIHTVKWIAKNIPDEAPRTSWVCEIFLNSSRCFIRAIGARRSAANDNLNAAMTTEGAPSACANRINMLAVDIAAMAPTIVIGRMIMTRELFTMPVSILPGRDQCKQIV